MEKVRALARKVSNWGRWGTDDERGTLNFITPEMVRARRGVREARAGLQPRAAASAPTGRRSGRAGGSTRCT